jgi:hypothetical protein
MLFSRTNKSQSESEDFSKKSGYREKFQCTFSFSRVSARAVYSLLDLDECVLVFRVHHRYIKGKHQGQRTERRFVSKEK